MTAYQMSGVVLFVPDGSCLNYTPPQPPSPTPPRQGQGGGYTGIVCLSFCFCICLLFLVDDLQKSRGLHSVSAYRHGLYIYRSMPAGIAQSSYAFVGGYTEHVGKMTDTHKQRQKMHQKCRSSAHCSWGTCRSGSRFPQLVV